VGGEEEMKIPRVNKKLLLALGIAAAGIAAFWVGLNAGWFSASSSTTTTSSPSSSSSGPSPSPFDASDTVSLVFSASAALLSIINSLTPHTIELDVGTVRLYVNSPTVELTIAFLVVLFGIVLALGLYKRVVRKR
jgi:membrane protein implicated in regulation of membrane protease activity